MFSVFKVECVCGVVSLLLYEKKEKNSSRRSRLGCYVKLPGGHVTSIYSRSSFFWLFPFFFVSYVRFCVEEFFCFEFVLRMYTLIVLVEVDRLIVKKVWFWVFLMVLWCESFFQNSNVNK